MARATSQSTRAQHKTDRDAQRQGRPARPGLRLDHKGIGLLYLLCATVLGLISVVISLYLRLELDAPGTQYLCAQGVRLFASDAPCSADGHLWALLSSYHGMLMIFFVAIPALFAGFGSYLLPLQIGARDMAFPRLNQGAFGLFLAGALCGLLAMGRPEAAHLGALTLGRIGLDLAGLAMLLMAVNVITTVLNMRAPTLSLRRMPLLSWSLFLTGWLLLLALPVLAGAMVVMMGPGHNGPLNEAQAHWLFGHPELYMILLPAFGIISQVIASFTRPGPGRARGEDLIRLAMGTSAAAGFLLWAHQLFDGPAQASATRLALLSALCIAPALLVLAVWGDWLRHGLRRWNVPMLWAAGFIVLLLSGLASALTRAGQSGDALELVARFHYVASLSAAFAIFAGIYLWIGRFSGRVGAGWIGVVHFLAMFLGTNLIFAPQMLPMLGTLLPADRAPMLTGLGAALSLASFLWFLGGIGWTLRTGQRRPPAEIWGAGADTGEWHPIAPAKPAHSAPQKDAAATGSLAQNKL